MRYLLFLLLSQLALAGFPYGKEFTNTVVSVRIYRIPAAFFRMIRVGVPLDSDLVQVYLRRKNPSVDFRVTLEAKTGRAEIKPSPVQFVEKSDPASLILFWVPEGTTIISITVEERRPGSSLHVPDT